MPAVDTGSSFTSASCVGSSCSSIQVAPSSSISLPAVTMPWPMHAAGPRGAAQGLREKLPRIRFAACSFRASSAMCLEEKMHRTCIRACRRHMALAPVCSQQAFFPCLPSQALCPCCPHKKYCTRALSLLLGGEAPYPLGHTSPCHGLCDL